VRHIDDNTINDHIRRIMSQRGAISQLASKYGLDDIHKVERLSLLTLPNQLGQYRDNELASVEMRDRVKEYHEKT
jgi:hypothetical protein